MKTTDLSFLNFESLSEKTTVMVGGMMRVVGGVGSVTFVGSRM